MKTSVDLILTVDYEVFGNGSGSVRNCVVEPSAAMVEIANKHQVPLTFFVDTLEFSKMGKCPSTADDGAMVREQLKHFLTLGHDLQLHLHPQWREAIRTNEGWSLDDQGWRIGDFSEREVESMVRMAKNWLTDLAKEAGVPYCCDVFRAGGWAIQPSNHVVRALNACGIRIDSTIAPGLRNTDKRAWFDFTAVPQKSSWRCHGSVCEEGPGALLEVPIAVGEMSYWRHLGLLLAQRRRPGTPCGCHGHYAHSKHYWAMMRKVKDRLMNLGKVMFDFSVLPAEAMIDIVDQKSQLATGRSTPIVAISHSKNFTEQSAEALDELLTWAKTKEHVRFSTYGQWYQRLESSGPKVVSDFPKRSTPTSLPDLAQVGRIAC